METVNNVRLPVNMESNRDRTDPNDIVRVVFYGRVSTQHEQQLGAFENQMDWYQMLLRTHPNWKLVNEYSDKGVTGTKATARHGFMRMYYDALEAKDERPWDLIVTREVCRFSRNTVDSLTYVRKFKEMGIEVYFFNDGIWSMDRDGELRLTIFSALAQDESRKTSERVNSGLHTCREKGVLFGNGNILGYDLVKGATSVENTYVQNADSETVRKIYEWYLQGNGEKKIVSKLTEGHYTNTLGKVSWAPNTISRILRNKTYAGYKCYYKSCITNYLEHTRENLDEEDYRYIKGDWEPIISLEDWEKVQQIRLSKRRPDVKGQGKGKLPFKNRWCKVLVCQCGRSFKRYKWHVNMDGKKYYGYQCRNITEHRRRSFHEANGLSGEGFCNLKSIPEWKLEFQLIRILQRLWKQPDAMIGQLCEAIEEAYTEKEPVEASVLRRLNSEKQRLEMRLDNLMNRWLDGGIPDDNYERKKEEIDSRIKEIDLKLQENDNIMPSTRGIPVDTKESVMAEIRNSLEKYNAVLEGKLDSETLDALVENLVVRVVPMESGEVKWYMNFGKESSDPVQFVETDYTLLDSFPVGFEEARDYRKSQGSYLRLRQWQDIETKVYIRA